MLEYKGYIGDVTFDDEADTFHGRIINIREVVSFYGRTTAEIRTEFHNSVDDYLEFCAEEGVKPEKPFSGKFLVRLPPALHREAFIAAKKSDKSLNAWVRTLIEWATNDENKRMHNMRAAS
ncbi:MAG: type II toxin-antitoxin system HicB family antitoxin [Magnetococcales bacterium]|nr:type II toxin-antitoxin system HicB family antitoxin [Magnetococcales bacterium]